MHVLQVEVGQLGCSAEERPQWWVWSCARCRTDYISVVPKNNPFSSSELGDFPESRLAPHPPPGTANGFGSVVRFLRENKRRRSYSENWLTSES